MKQIENKRGVIRELFRDFCAERGWAYKFWILEAIKTSRGDIRDLHAEELWKLVAVVEGEAFGAYVDVRPDSPSRGMVVITPLTKGM